MNLMRSSGSSVLTLAAPVTARNAAPLAPLALSTLLVLSACGDRPSPEIKMPVNSTTPDVEGKPTPISEADAG